MKNRKWKWVEDKRQQTQSINEVTCSLFWSPISIANAKPVVATMSNKTRLDVFRTSGRLRYSQSVFWVCFFFVIWAAVGKIKQPLRQLFSDMLYFRQSCCPISFSHTPTFILSHHPPHVMLLSTDAHHDGGLWYYNVLFSNFLHESALFVFMEYGMICPTYHMWCDVWVEGSRCKTRDA